MDEGKYSEIHAFLMKRVYPARLDKFKKRVFRRLCKKYAAEDDKLFYIGKGKKPLVVKGSERAKDIFRELHNIPFGGHPGINKTKRSIGSRFYWPSMTVDIRKWIMECHHCQTEPRPTRISVQKQHVQTWEVWGLVEIHLIGPLPITSRGNKYIFTATDFFSKWVDAFPHQTDSAQEVASSLVKIFFHRGCPRRILSDRGQEFVDEINSELCKRLQLKQWAIAAYQPQTAGLEERENTTLKSTLAQYVSDHQEDWDNYVASAVYSIVSTPNPITEVSPFFLMYNREARCPSNDTSLDLEGKQIVLPQEKDYEHFLKKMQGKRKSTKAQKSSTASISQEKTNEGSSKEAINPQPAQETQTEDVKNEAMTTQNLTFQTGNYLLITL